MPKKEVSKWKVTIDFFSDWIRLNIKGSNLWEKDIWDWIGTAVWAIVGDYDWMTANDKSKLLMIILMKAIQHATTKMSTKEQEVFLKETLGYVIEIGTALNDHTS